MQETAARRLRTFTHHVQGGKPGPVSVICRTVSADEEEEEEGPLSGLKIIPLVGDAMDQNEDYIGGLEDFVARVDPKTVRSLLSIQTTTPLRNHTVQGLGYYLNEYGNEVLLVTNPDHVTEILTTCTSCSCCLRIL